MAAPQKFINEVSTELRKVVWPTRQDIIRLTLVVLTISIFVGIYIGGLDYILTKAESVLISLRK